jgi:hypothetical protein
MLFEGLLRTTGRTREVMHLVLAWSTPKVELLPKDLVDMSETRRIS